MKIIFYIIIFSILVSSKEKNESDISEENSSSNFIIDTNTVLTEGLVNFEASEYNAENRSVTFTLPDSVSLVDFFGTENNFNMPIYKSNNATTMPKASLLSNDKMPNAFTLDTLKK